MSARRYADPFRCRVSTCGQPAVVLLEFPAGNDEYPDVVQALCGPHARELANTGNCRPVAELGDFWGVPIYEFYNHPDDPRDGRPSRVGRGDGG